jgi:2-amino-4-hydroxy-6-hydroxymethyldihydropteridine diphosphokinase
MSDNRAILLLGSNIDPARNIQKALDLLECSLQINKKSNLWVTEAVGSDGPEFLNMAIEVETKLNADQIKSEVIFSIEKELLRIRTADKYAPRTIDIDLIVFNEIVLDPNLWQRLFVALPVSEILPDLTNNSTGESVSEAVIRLKNSAKAELFIELK